MFKKLATFEQRLDVLNRMLMDPDVVSNSTKLRELSQEHAHVSTIVEAYENHKRLETELADAQEMLAEDDPDLREMAREEIGTLEADIASSTQQLRLLLLPKDPYEGRPILLEIRAGTGGDEAAIFAADLMRMYSRFGERNGLRIEIMSTNQLTVGGGSGKSIPGFKEIIAAVTGSDAYSLLRFEAGVHRVQRVPVTESQGRIPPRPRRSPCCPSRMRLRSRSTPKTSASTPCERAVRVDNPSTRRTRPSESSIFQQESSFSVRTKKVSTKIRKRRCAF